jgi:hypothetical protein
MTDEDREQEQVTRTEVRPGLVMIKRRTLKPDGRYLIYYDFERSPGSAEAPPNS